jgi:hypothetical protein
MSFWRCQNIDVYVYIHCAKFQAQVHGGILSLWTAPPSLANPLPNIVLQLLVLD